MSEWLVVLPAVTVMRNQHSKVKFLHSKMEVGVFLQHGQKHPLRAKTLQVDTCRKKSVALDITMDYYLHP